MAASAVEFEIHGHKITGKRWGKKGGIPVIALHGWLDNANSFDFIAPLLPELDLVVIEFAGHGLSDHRPRLTPYLGSLYIQEIIGVADQLNWPRFSLLAHSMGAELSTHIIGLYADRVERFLALDGFAASASPATWLQDMRKSLDENLHREPSQMRVFASREEMAARVADATGQTLASAKSLVARGAKEQDGGVVWRSDPRVRWSDALSLSHEVIEHIVTAFTGQILVIAAADGNDWYKPTMERLKGISANLRYITLAGSHHLHMDDDTAPLVAVIREFFEIDDLK